MSRTVTMPAPVKPPGVNPHPHYITRVYTLQLITPLFGGGVEGAVNDPITVIRPSSIRGHLRFWWRATRGAAYNSVERLREREGEIWGTTVNPSSVQVDIKVITRSEPEPCAKYDWNSEKKRHDLLWNSPFDDGPGYPYALFPFQGKPGDDAAKPACYIRRVEFEFTLRYLDLKRLNRLREIENEKRRRLGYEPLCPTIEDIQPDVEAAIWAWVNFGGIGARTRRGCGALYCSHVTPSNPDIHPPSADQYGKWLAAKLASYKIAGSNPARPWPILFRSVFVKVSNKDALGCWNDAIQLLKDFRQGRNVGRDPGTGGKPGQSRWPEAESVRKLILNQRGLSPRPSTLHPADPRMAGLPSAVFPRAELGMPIIFEIRERIPKASDNIKPTLQFSDDADRMASPVILRPMRFSNGKSVAFIGVLATESLASAYLKAGDNGRDLTVGVAIASNQIHDVALERYSDSPLGGPVSGSPRSQGSGSAIVAFESFAVEKGYTKVFP